MTTRYVLIDHENVQPKDLGLLDGQLKIKVFIGANQAKLSTDLAMAMQARGPSAEYVRIAGNGRNALDFHIAFYLGELATKEPGASFHVISKDDGYDPLLAHLKSRGISAQRSPALTPLLPAADERLQRVIDHLRNAGTARPRRTKTLANSIATLFANSLEQAEILGLIEELRQRGDIAVNDTKVVYP